MVIRRVVAGFSLVEVLVGVALFAMLGAGTIGVVTSGAKTAARAGEGELAALAGMRAMDDLVAEGYDRLLARAGTDRALALPPLDAGLACAARCRCVPVDRGLVRLTLSLAWRRADSDAPGSLTLTRCVADAWAGLAVRGAAGGAR